MKKLAASFLFFLSTAHAGVDVPFTQLENGSMNIVWITEGDISKTCENIGLPYRYDGWQACASVSYDKKTCTIYTNKRTSHEILGHELRHCFQGAFH